MNWMSDWAGQISYEKGLALQAKALELVKSEGRQFVIGLEHPAVVTLGVRGREEKDVFADCELPVIKIRRGGEATIHSPGQLVIYPVVDLKELNLGVRQFVNILMDATASVLDDFGIKTFRKCEPGLFTDKGKICFVGIQVRSGITQHGIALNVNNDLNLFGQISVCGVRGESLDRVSHYIPDVGCEALYAQWTAKFTELCGSASTQVAETTCLF